MPPATIALPTDARHLLALAEPFVAARPFLLVSDFDGTLSRIVLDPWAARIIPGAQRALRRMARLEGVHVALLSGRLARDLAGRARIGGVTYVGNFGMERGSLRARGWIDRLQVQVVELDDELVALADRLADEVPRRVGADWLVVERKPASVAFHFRAAPDLEVAAAMVRAAADALDPDGRLARYAGRRALELRPPGAPDKGEAFRALLAEYRPSAALMLGDDVSDVPAFVALREARTNGALAGMAIAVRARDAVPGAVADAADVVLDSPMEAARFLTLLARRMTPAGPRRAAAKR